MSSPNAEAQPKFQNAQNATSLSADTATDFYRRVKWQMRCRFYLYKKEINLSELQNTRFPDEYFDDNDTTTKEFCSPSCKNKGLLTPC